MTFSNILHFAHALEITVISRAILIKHMRRYEILNKRNAKRGKRNIEEIRPSEVYKIYPIVIYSYRSKEGTCTIAQQLGSCSPVYRP